MKRENKIKSTVNDLDSHGNYLVATIHWWANNMKKKNENKPIYANRITILLYFTFERVPIVFTMPIPIETVTLVRTTRAVHLMIFFAIHAFKDMKTWLTIFSSHSICFLILHITLCFLPVMFGHMSSIVLGTPGDVRVTVECWMSPFPAVLTLWNTQIHIGITNSRNKSSNIELMIDNVLYWRIALCCSNHSSLKDKWSHNEQSSSMGYQVKSGGITRELDKEPSLYYPLYIYMAPGPCYNNIYLALKSMHHPHVHYSSTCVFHKATMLLTCALMSYL